MYCPNGTDIESIVSKAEEVAKSEYHESKKK